jgi:hypothetical protein
VAKVDRQRQRGGHAAQQLGLAVAAGEIDAADAQFLVPGGAGQRGQIALVHEVHAAVGGAGEVQVGVVRVHGCQAKRRKLR